MENPILTKVHEAVQRTLLDNLHSVLGAFMPVTSFIQERERYMNSRKILGNYWDIRRDKQGSTGRCPRDFPVSCKEKLTKKGIFVGALSRGLQKFYVIFLMCLFCSSPLMMRPRLSTFFYAVCCGGGICEWTNEPSYCRKNM